MAEITKMADEAKRMGQQAQEGAERAGREFQKAAEGGFEAVSRSFSEANRGFQALAAEMMNYSKEAFDDAVRTWEQLIGVKSLDQAIEIQSQYAERVYDKHMAELAKLGEMCMWYAIRLSQLRRVPKSSDREMSRPFKLELI